MAPDEALTCSNASPCTSGTPVKKYVQQSVSEIIDTRGNKKQKNESGQDVKKGADAVARAWTRSGAERRGRLRRRRSTTAAARVVALAEKKKAPSTSNGR